MHGPKFYLIGYKNLSHENIMLQNYHFIAESEHFKYHFHRLRCYNYCRNGKNKIVIDVFIVIFIENNFHYSRHTCFLVACHLSQHQ